MSKIVKKVVSVFIGVAVATSLLGAVELDSKKIVVNNKSIKARSTLGENSKNSIYSTGARYLENVLKSKSEIEKFSVKEIYARDINAGWKGGIFHISGITKNGQKIDTNQKLFYNNQIVSLDLFLPNGTPLSQSLNLPLKNPEKVYDAEYLIHSVGKNSLKQNMVIFSDPQCPYCREYMNHFLDIAKKNNLNVYYYSYPLPIPSHVNSKNLAKCIDVAIRQDKENSLLILKNIYAHDFGSSLLSLDKLVNEFNSVSGVKPIDVNTVKSDEVEKKTTMEFSRVKDFNIKSFPCVYIGKNKL